jgi:hypothetical protein
MLTLVTNHRIKLHHEDNNFEFFLYSCHKVTNENISSKWANLIKALTTSNNGNKQDKVNMCEYKKECQNLNSLEQLKDFAVTFSQPKS